MTENILKVCVICKAQKPLQDFNLNRGRKDGHQTFCRDCGKRRSRTYYSNNREKHVKKIYKRKLQQIAISRVFVLDYFKKHPCVDCGFDKPAALDFDHVRGKKRNLVSALINGGYSLKTIQTEIAKCEVRCANCHRLKTAKDFNWYSWDE